MNRELKQRNRKGCAYRMHASGYEMGAPLVPFQSQDDLSFSAKVPVNHSYSDCAFPERPGHITIAPQPDLAQTAMAGGYRSEYMPVNTQGTYKVDLPISQGFPNCGGVNVQSTIMAQAHPEKAQTPMAGGGCACMANMHAKSANIHRGLNLIQTPMAGGRCFCFRKKTRNGQNMRKNRTRKHIGGTRGFSVDPWQNVGGDGPNAAPVNNPVSCDSRAGSFNPYSQTTYNPDPRAPTDVYSLTTNQTGGSYATSNGYSDACYKAPGSSLPVYAAETAGFRFEPSTAHGASMPDGVTAFNEVIPQPARVGGRRKRTLRKKLRK